MSINARNCTGRYGISLDSQRVEVMRDIGAEDVSEESFGSLKPDEKRRCSVRNGNLINDY